MSCMESEINKLKKIFIISIIENIFHFFFIALMITAIIFLTMTSDGYKDPYGNISFTRPELWITFIVISFILLILNTISSTFILATKWENEYSRKSNKLWGLLSLFLLGSISLLIFTKKSIKYCRKVENKNEAR